MNNQHNSHETIYSAETSNAEAEIGLSVIVTASSGNLNLTTPEVTVKTTSCDTSNNVTENDGPNSSENRNSNDITPAVNVESNHQINKNTEHLKFDTNVIDIILQQTLHRPKNISLNLDFEDNSEQTQKSQLKHAKNVHILTRAGRNLPLEETESSNSSSEDLVILNARTNCNPSPQVNRRIAGVASDSNVIASHQNPLLKNLACTRSETRVNDVEAEILRIRDEESRNQEPSVEIRSILNTVPETSQNSSRPSRNTFRENRLLRYTRSLRGSVNAETNASQQTYPQSYSTPPLAEAPPTYSAIIRFDDVDDTVVFANRNVVGVQQSPPFIPPRPPPTYAEAEGFAIARPMFLASIEELIWGPEPTYIVCPRCTHLILTRTRTHISSVNHVSALILCIFGCWPCCFIPYCIDSCKNTYHFCPNCSLFLGVHRPW